MKIRSVSYNNRKKSFEIKTTSQILSIPYARLEAPLRGTEKVSRVFVDKELAREAFTYILDSGAEGTVHIDQVLEYNQDPSYLRDALVYKLTIEAQKCVDASGLSKREIIRRLGTSATQFYRLLDQMNYRKSIDKMLELLHVLNCDVDLIVRAS